MWISTQIKEKPTENQTQTGRVTLNSDGKMEVIANGVDRNIETFLPYGYSCLIPRGEEVLLTQSGGEQIALGVRSSGNALKSGEIKILARSGAYIHLRNDGSVVINGLEITRDGEIVNE